MIKIRKVSNMKKNLLIAINMIIISGVLIFGANAFQKGENRIGNGAFEADKVGDLPSEWTLKQGG